MKIKERSLLLSLPSKNLKGNFVCSVTLLRTQHEEMEEPVKYAAIHKRRGSVPRHHWFRRARLSDSLLNDFSPHCLGACNRLISPRKETGGMWRNVGCFLRRGVGGGGSAEGAELGTKRKLSRRAVRGLLFLLWHLK